MKSNHNALESVGTQQEFFRERTIILSVVMINSLRCENVVLGFAAS